MTLSSSHSEVLQEALRQLADRCSRLVGMCYWAGTSSVAIEELGHRESLDLDFHTYAALVDVRPVLAEIQRAFPGAFWRSTPAWIHARRARCGIGSWRG